MNIPYVLKKCSKCGEWKVASTINFYKKKDGKYGLQPKCKECCAEHGKQYYKDNKEMMLEHSKQYYKDNKEKVAERNKQYCQDNKEKIAESKKQYYEANKEKILKQQKQYYEDNKEKVADYQKQYYKNNKEKILEHNKQYRQTPQGQVVSFNRSSKRRLKEENQGSGATKDQWLEMMKFFDFRCAYTGEKLTDKTRSTDHIVPIDAEGDHMIWNMVPMIRSLNCSKRARNMEKWYREQDYYDPKRLAKIYKWQEYAYNKYGKDSEYFNTNDIQITLL